MAAPVPEIMDTGALGFTQPLVLEVYGIEARKYLLCSNTRITILKKKVSRIKEWYVA
jgi:hypothetical protein